MNQKSVVSINLIVRNGKKYVSQCLESIFKQTYPHNLLELNILDNASVDDTVHLIKQFRNTTLGAMKINLIESKKNLGVWPGQDELLKHTTGKYIVALSVDVRLDSNFVENSVKILEIDFKIGALQPKIYQDHAQVGYSPHFKGIIDTCGFKIFRSRRVVNIGHGEEDHGQYGKTTSTEVFGTSEEIFAVEGAAPVFLKKALEDCRLKTQDQKFSDLDFFWYGDDLDLAWRMRLFGWRQIFAPNVIAYHDRQTTKNLAGGNWREFIKIRGQIPMFKRRLDWRNMILTIIKNDRFSDLFRDLPRILWRQLKLWGYFVIFEPSMILEILTVVKLLPKMLERRREIMSRLKVEPNEIRRWFFQN